MNRSRSHSFVLAAATIVLAACAVTSAPPSEATFPEDAYSRFTVGVDPLDFELRTAPAQPPDRGAFAMELRVVDRAGRPREGLDIDVVPFMGAHGHGSTGAPNVTALGDGRYRIDGLALSMPGFWQLYLTIRGEGIDSHASTTIEVR